RWDRPARGLFRTCLVGFRLASGPKGAHMAALRRVLSRLFRSPTGATAPRGRSLEVEGLEARDLFSGDLRIADYTIAGAARSGLATVLRAIGDQVVNGVSRPVDVLAIQETDSQSTDTQAVVDLLNGIYGSGTYARGNLNGSSTGAGTQGLIYRASTVPPLA